MAGFDLSIQKAAGMYGARVDFGSYAFTGDEVTVELPITLSTVLAFIGTTSDGTVCTSDKTVTNGALTITRPAGGSADATFDYIALGY